MPRKENAREKSRKRKIFSKNPDFHDSAEVFSGVFGENGNDFFGKRMLFYSFCFKNRAADVLSASNMRPDVRAPGKIRRRFLILICIAIHFTSRFVRRFRR